MRVSTVKFLVKLATVVAVLFFVLLFVLLTFQYVKINELEKVQSRLNIELSTLEQQRQSAESELEYIQDNYDSYVEDYVREVLGWGRENEIKFQGE